MTGLLRSDGGRTMNKERCTHACGFERAAQVEFRNLSEAVSEMKTRMSRLEQTLGRGVALLLANLVGMVFMLAGRLVG